MNSGWFKLKLKPDLSEGVRLIKRLSFSFTEGMDPSVAVQSNTVDEVC